MGGRGTGAHRWPRDCPICGETYVLTNWMRIWPWEQFWLYRGGNRVLVTATDKHVRSCARKQKLEPSGPPSTAYDRWASSHRSRRS